MSKPDKAKTICEMYKKGYSVSEISKLLDCEWHAVKDMLRRHYFEFYKEQLQKKQQILASRTEYIYNRYNELYVPFVYTEKEMCEKIGCTVAEFERMLLTYNLKHQRLNLSKKSKSLCNMSVDFYEVCKAYCDEKGISVRELACRAINEYMLCEELNKCKEK